MKARQDQQGYITITVLVFAAVFALITSGLIGFIFVHNHSIRVKELRERAFSLAEAGLEYYKWHLAHYPSDFQDGTGEPGPYLHEYYDPEGGLLGTYSLEIDQNLTCGEVGAVTIRSTGSPADDASITRTIYGKYARPSVAEYSTIVNSNVWAGDDRIIRGRYHSNGGVRMDGTHDSLVTSAQTDWLCTSSFGCSPNQTQSGVFGEGSNELWDYPVPQVDFVGITLDLSGMKSRAQSNGIYVANYSGTSNQRGYRLIFKPDRSVDIYRITQTTVNWGYSIENDWNQEYTIINRQQFVENRQIPADCGLIFVEDKVWIEGSISGKITVAAAKIVQANAIADVVLNGNITYTTDDGSDGLTVVAENSVVVPLVVPNDMKLSGIFIAQNGAFGRNHYVSSGSTQIPNAYDQYIYRDSLELHGTIVSNGRIGTKWTCSGTYCSGFEVREESYDRKLATDPPPMTPYMSDEYRFVEWQDEG